jgi:hypothetical protein
LFDGNKFPIFITAIDGQDDLIPLPIQALPLLALRRLSQHLLTIGFPVEQRREDNAPGLDIVFSDFGLCRGLFDAADKMLFY